MCDAAASQESAERRAGELLRQMRERGERRKPGDNQHGSNGAQLPPKLSDLGITKTQSWRWQAAAALPAEEFEKQVEGSEVSVSAEGRFGGAQAGHQNHCCLTAAAWCVRSALHWSATAKIGQ